MPSFNKVILMGNVTRDIELRTTAGGQKVANLGLAVNETWIKEGQRNESTLFVDVTCWGRDAEIAAEYLKKGSPVLIEGRLKLDTWEQDGNRRSKLTVTCERLKLIQSRAAQSNGSEEGQRAEAEEAVPF